MAKKKGKKRSFEGIVYSTDPEFEPETYDKQGEETPPPGQQDLRILLRRLKGNKVATVVTEFVGPAEDLKDLGKLLKRKCGAGGAAKDGEIIVQGDHRETVGQVLKQEGYRFKFSGG